MLKIFTPEERKAMGRINTVEAKLRFPNKAFIMIDGERKHRESSDGIIWCGLEGILYAIADLEDKEDYDNLITKLDDEGVSGITLFTSFDIREV